MLFLFGLSTANAASAAQSQIDPRLCQQLTKHTPRADVEYQAGVDVHGNQVAPADLAGSNTLEIPKRFNIPLTVNLAKALNLNTANYPTNQFGQGTEANLGVFTVDGDKVLFNGKPLDNSQQDNLAVLCLKAD